MMCLLVWTPPYLKYVATLPCNLSLVTVFAEINVSQGSVAAYARCGGIFNIRLSPNYKFTRESYRWNLKKNRFTFDRIVAVRL